MVMTQSPQEKLAACPFCGNGNTLMVEHVEGTVLHPAYYVRCDNCGAIGPTTDNGGHADLWNSRPATLLSEHGEVTVTTDESGRCVAVTRQDSEGRILSTIWEAPEHGGGGEAVDRERVAQLTAHRACGGEEHDPANGKLHGCCVVCLVPWPCAYAGTPPTPSASCPATPMDLIAADPTVAYKRGWDDAMKQAAPSAPFRGLDSQGKPIYKDPPAVTLTATDRTTPSAPVVDDALRRAATDIIEVIRQIPEEDLLALDSDPHPPSALSELANQLEDALSGVSAPVGVEQGSVAVDWDDDPQRQLSIMVKRDGSVTFAAFANGQRFSGDAKSPEFWRALSALAASGHGVEGWMRDRKQVEGLASHLENVGWAQDERGDVQCMDQGAAMAAEVVRKVLLPMIPAAPTQEKGNG